MKTTFARGLFVAALALVLIIPSEAIGNKIKVVIKNDIPGESITIGCYSKDDNLGTHTLSYGADFNFGFGTTFTTKFYCDFKISHGSGNYGVFTSRLENLCNQNCLWLIRANGPCLLQSDRTLYCQPWKNA